MSAREDSVLIVSQSNRVRRIISRALISADCHTEVCALDRHEVVRAMDAQPHSLVLIDTDDGEEEARAILDVLSKTKPNAVPLVLASDLKSPLLRELVRAKGVNNILRRRGGLSASEEPLEEHELIVTCRKLLSKELFGLEKYLSWGVGVRDLKLRSSSEKADALAEVDAFLSSIDCRTSVRQSVGLVCDELLMNAIFSAPRDSEGRAKYNERTRREPLTLGEGEEVALRYGCDGQYFYLSVTDLFGSLERDVLVKYVEDVFAGEMAVPQLKAGGAGIGLHLVLNSVTQLVFNIEPGKKTEVIATFYVRRGGRAFRERGRSLNIFVR